MGPGRKREGKKKRRGEKKKRKEKGNLGVSSIYSPVRRRARKKPREGEREGEKRRGKTANLPNYPQFSVTLGDEQRKRKKKGS